jgi:hypothetical protein
MPQLKDFDLIFVSRQPYTNRNHSKSNAGNYVFLPHPHPSDGPAELILSQLAGRTFLHNLSRLYWEDRLSIFYDNLWTFFYKHKSTLKDLRLNIMLLADDLLARKPVILRFLGKVRHELSLEVIETFWDTFFVWNGRVEYGPINDLVCRTTGNHAKSVIPRAAEKIPELDDSDDDDDDWTLYHCCTENRAL